MPSNVSNYEISMCYLNYSLLHILFNWRFLVCLVFGFVFFLGGGFKNGFLFNYHQLKPLKHIISVSLRINIYLYLKRSSFIFKSSLSVITYCQVWAWWRSWRSLLLLTHSPAHRTGDCSHSTGINIINSWQNRQPKSKS